MFKDALDRGIILEDVIPRNSRIEFCTDDDVLWFGTTVKSIKDSEVVLDFPDLPAVARILLADRMVCRHYNDEYEYKFESMIEFINFNPPQYIELRLSGEVQRFKNTRQPTGEGALFSANICAGEGQEVMHAHVTEIGRYGLKVTSVHEICVGSEISIDIILPVKNILDSVVKLQGRVVWCRNCQTHMEYGIDIVRMDDIQKSRLEQFCVENMRMG